MLLFCLLTLSAAIQSIELIDQLVGLSQEGVKRKREENRDGNTRSLMWKPFT